MRNKEKDKAWREANKERLALYMKQWKEDNQKHLIQYRLDNKDKLLETSKNWQKTNKEKAKVIQKRYCDKNRQLLNEKNIIYRKENREVYLKNKKQSRLNNILNDPNFKFTQNIRSLINMSFKRGKIKFKKPTHTEIILDCSINFFIDYILSKCPEGVTIKDFHMHGYHIDHIIPISSGKSIDEIVKLCHYTNLQPLWCIENIKKSNKILI